MSTTDWAYYSCPSLTCNAIYAFESPAALDARGMNTEFCRWAEEHDRTAHGIVAPYSATERRTTSTTGGEKGVKDERHSLMPREGLDAISRVFGFGASKYADHNWRRGYEWSKSYDALQRHLIAFWSGETNDPESGLPHLGHAGFHVLALLTWLEEQGEGGQFDDRYIKQGEAA